MFSFFKKKPPAPETPPAPPAADALALPSAPAPASASAAYPGSDSVPYTGAYPGPAPVTEAEFVPELAAVPLAGAAAELVAGTPAAIEADAPAPAIAAPSPSRRYGTTSTFIAPPVAPVLPAAPAAQEARELIPETAERLGSEADRKQSWMARLKAGLSKTSNSLNLLFVGATLDEDLYEELESALLMADAGMDATEYLLTALRRRVKDDKLLDAAAVKAALKELMTDMLRPLEKPLELGRHEPLVMMIAGVNGAGKTTTIGKLAKHMQRYEQSVLLAAGDTFRAAAREQLMVWGQRNNVTVIAQESGDPAAVAFDAVQSGKAKKMDVVMVDTAGRLPTQLHLMEELKKIKRVIGKGMDGAPHEVLLVIDGNTGQNALAQVKAFDDALSLTGLVITKLDGTAKGGVLAAIARTRPIPVYFIGVGEKIDDLQPFSADEFVEALLG